MKAWNMENNQNCKFNISFGNFLSLLFLFCIRIVCEIRSGRKCRLLTRQNKSRRSSSRFGRTMKHSGRFFFPSDPSPPLELDGKRDEWATKLFWIVAGVASDIVILRFMFYFNASFFLSVNFIPFFPHLSLKQRTRSYLVSMRTQKKVNETSFAVAKKWRIYNWKPKGEIAENCSKNREFKAGEGKNYNNEFDESKTIRMKSL